VYQQTMVNIEGDTICPLHIARRSGSSSSLRSLLGMVGTEVDASAGPGITLEKSILVERMCVCESGATSTPPLLPHEDDATNNYNKDENDDAIHLQLL